MSVQAVKDFLKAAESDLDIKKKLRDAKSPNKVTTLTNIVTLAATLGFTFTSAEYEGEVASELKAVFDNHRAVFHHHLINVSE